MSIALDGNGNSVPEGGKALADQNVKRLAEVVTKGAGLYGLAPRHVLAYYLDVLESHVESEKQRRLLRAYCKEADPTAYGDKIQSILDHLSAPK